ncbi:hypothetical protein GSS87_08750 [Corynebacterium sp. 4HC-13]|uniref:ROK family protein n=1 Tax=Corynebacterium anserum TaxID=2684406 RepID=UPI001639CEA2|nr:ROK family protein [Corynebacterium anserum]MBC2682474.1 hypothetical protein [Corynebacterium anserum]
MTSPIYGWDRVPAAAKLTEVFPHIPLTVSTGVSAMAGHELATHVLSAARGTGPHRDFRSTLYFYARDVISHAWIIGGRVHHPYVGGDSLAFRMIAESGSLPSFPDAIPVSNTALVRAAAQRGLGECKDFEELVSRARRDEATRALLDERADLLAKAGWFRHCL